MPITATIHTTQTSTQIPSTTTISTTETPMRVKVDKIPVDEKMRSYSVTTGQDTYLDFIFQNDLGNPYDVHNLPANYELKVIMVESVTGSKVSSPEVILAASTEDQQRGKLRIHLTKNQTASPAIFRCSVICEDTTTNSVVQENSFFIYISNPAGKKGGPPSILEIRLQIRDTSPTENLLLDGVTFTDEEIALAVMRPVDYFNEVQPDVGVYYSTNNFPYRYFWIEGIIAQLYRIVSEYHRKNQLQYTAGGVALNDKNKEQNYEQAAERHWAVFMEFVKREKVKINVAQGYRHVPSRYSYWR